eukprot:scaffold4347_cov117-Cylindrotheca_fusiformis.AAC.1
MRRFTSIAIQTSICTRCDNKLAHKINILYYYVLVSPDHFESRITLSKICPSSYSHCFRPMLTKLPSFFFEKTPVYGVLLRRLGVQEQ